MALDWSKANRRKSSSENVNDAALMRVATEPAAPQPSKADLRAEAEEAIATWNRPVQRLPTFIELKCWCGHRGRVKVAPGRRKRFRCSKCGYLSL